MIQFHCENCGHKFSAPQAGIGESVRCPDCKNIVVVSGVDSEDSILDPNLFDIPPKAKVAARGDISDKASENLQKLLGEPEPPPKRKLPWIIDIFLYPADKPGLTMIGIFVGVPLSIEIFSQILGLVTSQFPPFFVFALFFMYIGLIVNVIMMFYMFWYFCECIRDSAVGGIRAPETMTTTGELGQIFSFVITWMVFWLPAILYTLVKYPPFEMLGVAFTLPEGASPIGLLFQRIQSDLVFSLLWFYAIYFFPMALLGVVLFGSLAGLNPLLIISSILRAFFRYFLLVVIFYIPIIALIGMFALPAYLPQTAFRFGLLGLLLYFAWVWLLLIVGHLTGRYYYRNEKKLYWDI